MKLRIAAFALAIAFLAAPALAAFAETCPPCGDSAQDSAPCTSLSAASCCGDVAPAAPVKTAPELSKLHALAGGVSHPLAFSVRAPHAARELAAFAAVTRLSVVRRL